MTFLRLWYYLAALVAAAPFVRPQKALGSLLIWVPKLIGGALAPWNVVLGSLGGVLGLARRDWKLSTAGFASAWLSGLYWRRLNQAQADFEQVFGIDWRVQLPPGVQTRLLPRRWQARLPQPQRLIWQPDIRYGRHRRTGGTLTADIWKPSPPDYQSGLAIIYVHGGAWRYGSKDMGTRPFFRRLVANGHLVMDLDYTLDPDATLLALVDDIRQGIDWLKRHGDRYGVRPDRIVLAGGSAGGHLALLTAYSEGCAEIQQCPYPDTSVCGVIAFYPPADFNDGYQRAQAAYGYLAQKGQLNLGDHLTLLGLRLLQMAPPDLHQEANLEYYATVMGGTPAELPEMYRLVSPVSHVDASCPPTLILQGSDDVFQLAPATRRLHHLLLTAGVPSIYLEYPHTDHAFDLVLPQISPVAQTALYDVERFLAMLVSG